MRTCFLFASARPESGRSKLNYVVVLLFTLTVRASCAHPHPAEGGGELGLVVQQVLRLLEQRWILFYNLVLILM